MPLPSSSGRRGPGSRSLSSPAGGKRSGDPLDQDRIRLERDLQELRRKEAELRRLEEIKMREMEDLPRKLAERDRKQREMMRLRAVASVTDDAFGRLRDKRHAPLRRSGSTPSKRMTRPEQRAARLQFLVLCGVLAVILMLLWKSIR